MRASGVRRWMEPVAPDRSGRPAVGRRIVLAGALVAMTSLVGACASPCLEIQYLVCDCTTGTQDERTLCEQIAEDQETLSPPSAEQLATCEALIPTCEAFVAEGCDALRMPEGRKACGMARAPLPGWLSPAD